MPSGFERLLESELADLLPKVEAGERLSRSEGLRLWATSDLTSLGVLANRRREHVSGNAAFYRSSIHVNYTRQPTPACPLCSDAAQVAGDPMPAEEWCRLLERLDSNDSGEIHLTGGPNPLLGADDLCRFVRLACELRPSFRLRAFTWADLEAAAEKDCCSPDRVLVALAQAGLTCLAGGSLIDLTPENPHLDREHMRQIQQRTPWIEVAAGLDFKCELSWVFGYGDDPALVVDSLISIRALQDQWKIFESFTPLLFHWPSEGIELPIPTGYDQLRALAVGRLFMDNILRIRSSWRALTESMAQVAQWYGADDADCAILSEGITDLDPELKDIYLGRQRLEELLRAAGRRPVESQAGRLGCL